MTDTEKKGYIYVPDTKIKVTDINHRLAKHDFSF